MSDKYEADSYGERNITSHKRVNAKRRRKRKRIRQIKRGLLFVGLLLCIVIAWDFAQELFPGNLLASDVGVSRTSENESYHNLTEPKAYSDSEISENLKELAQTSKEYREIYDNIDLYPDDLLAALCSNSEMLEFVSGYLNADSNTNGEFTSEELEESFPLLMQWDDRWGYDYYGDDCIGLVGCAPTCMSMVVLGLTKDKDATPDQVAAYAQKEGYYIQGTGTSWSLMTEGALHFGIEGNELSLNESTVLKELQAGHPIICSMRPGDFTTQGHFIVLIGVQDGKIIVNDPNSKKRSGVLWDYDTLARQIKNLWVFLRK